VRGKPKKGEPSNPESRTAGGEQSTPQNHEANRKRDEPKSSEKREQDVEANDPFDSGPGETSEDDERTTNTNNEGSTAIAEEDPAEEDKGGFCGDDFFDFCGKNEQGTEVQEKKNDSN